MDDGVVEDARRTVARRGLGRGLGAILPARSLPSTMSLVDQAVAGTTVLTGRAELVARLDLALAEAHRDDVALTVVVFGLLGFRHVNAAYGHEVGDALLHEVGARLVRMGRAGDVAGRLSGDEFALALPRTDAAVTGDRLVGRLHDVVARPVVAGGAEHRLRAAFGAAVSRPGAPAAAGRALLRQADLAMHRAKDAGVRWTLFEPARAGHAHQRPWWNTASNDRRGLRLDAEGGSSPAGTPSSTAPR